MKKKLWAVLLCIAIAMLPISLAGCGDTKQEEGKNVQSGETNVETDEQTKDEQTKEQAKDEQITLTIMSTLITEVEAPLEQAMADAYMAEHPNVKIEFIGQPVNDMAKKIIALNASGDLPDAFFMPTEFMSQAYDMGIVADHEKLLGEEFLSTLVESVVESAKIEGKLMLVPWHVIPVALIYRTDWLEEAGFETIETMDDFRAVAKAFTKDGHWGFSMVGTNNGSGQTRFTQYVRAFGVNEVYKNEEGMWVSDLTSDKYRKALQSFVDLVLVDGVVPPGVTETGYPEAVNYFAAEKTGLMISGSNAIGAILAANPNLKGKLGSVPIPKAERHVTNPQTSGYAITTACKHPEVMADYLKFITKPEIAIDFGVKSGRLPVTKEAMAAKEFQTKEFKGFIECMQYAIPQPSFPAYPEILDIMGESYSTMIGIGVSIDEAMARVEARLSSLLEKYNK